MQTMSFVKSVPEVLKLSECKRGIGGKNSPIRYIPEKDPVQEALESNNKTNYFKLMLPHMQQAEGHTLDVRDSQAVHTACVLSDSRIQTDGA